MASIRPPCFLSQHLKGVKREKPTANCSLLLLLAFRKKYAVEVFSCSEGIKGLFADVVADVVVVVHGIAVIDDGVFVAVVDDVVVVVVLVVDGGLVIAAHEFGIVVVALVMVNAETVVRTAAVAGLCSCNCLCRCCCYCLYRNSCSCSFHFSCCRYLYCCCFCCCCCFYFSTQK